MNEYFIIIIAGCLVFAAGGVAGFIIGRNLREDHDKELLQAEIDDIKSYYREKYGDDFRVPEAMIREENKRKKGSILSRIFKALRPKKKK